MCVTYHRNTHMICYKLYVKGYIQVSAFPAEAIARAMPIVIAVIVLFKIFLQGSVRNGSVNSSYNHINRAV